MKLIIKLILIFLFSTTINAREIGETEITTDDGIEVFQNDKFYLLKQNVKIVSDNFTLTADDVKINFDKSLDDITQLNANGNVDFYSKGFEIQGNGNFLNFKVKIEKIKVEGEGSELITKDVKMFSDGFIEVSNLSGDFFLKGNNSKLVNENIIIIAEAINGEFSDNEEKITGDYGTLDTKNNSYKIKSTNQNKVKVIIQDND